MTLDDGDNIIIIIIQIIIKFMSIVYTVYEK